MALEMNRSGGVHENIHSVGTHQYRVKKTVTPLVRVKVARNKRFKRYSSSKHVSY